MLIERMSAIELQRAIDSAVYYEEDSGPELGDALKEVQRLRIVCQDIIEIINADPDVLFEYGWLAGIFKIEDKAREYYKPVTEAPEKEPPNSK